MKDILSVFEDSDIKALKRFKEICDDFDADGHDLRKEQVKRLEQIGALRTLGFGRHEITLLGDFILERLE